MTSMFEDYDLEEAIETPKQSNGRKPVRNREENMAKLDDQLRALRGEPEQSKSEDEEEISKPRRKIKARVVGARPGGGSRRHNVTTEIETTAVQGKQPVTSVVTRCDIPGVVTGQQLINRKIPDVQFLVPEIISEGMTLLGGPPKSGKTYFLLDLAFSIASGRKFLDYDIKRRRVLYLALEDADIEIQKRILSQNSEEDIKVSDFHIVTKTNWLDIIGNNQYKKLENLVDEVEPEVIIIDTFIKFGGVDQSGDSRYDMEYRTLVKINEIAPEASIILSHHTRQLPAEEDWTHALSGGNGLIAVPDTILGFFRSRNDDSGTIKTACRRTSDSEIFFSHDPNTLRFIRVSENPNNSPAKTKDVILRVLREAGFALSPSEIVTMADDEKINSVRVRQALIRMDKSGEVVKVDRGKYTHVEEDQKS